MHLEKMRAFLEWQEEPESEDSDERPTMPIASYSVVAYEGRETEFLLYLFERLIEDTENLIEEVTCPQTTI